MKVRPNKHMVEVIDNVYIAKDGEEFNTEPACKEYEKKLETKEWVEKVSSLLVDGINFVPCDGAENREDHHYMWFKVNNKEELDLVNDVYNAGIKVKKFPEYVNIEQYDEDDFDCIGTTLTDCKEYVQLFFKNGFGIEVSFN